jgi:hypothetical protein
MSNSLWRRLSPADLLVVLVLASVLIVSVSAIIASI